ncbi:ArsR/SmtB family transcription factor [Planomonospora venezuelensis]|nr:metalloregulator ArsR/SmtB family transcription factor [Planomonospora venezuelensis]
MPGPATGCAPAPLAPSPVRPGTGADPSSCDPPSSPSPPPARQRSQTRLRHEAMPVTELAEAVGMEQSAVSHQLRLLRNLGLVHGTRNGRSIIYSLYDHHVAQLLDEAVYHIEHLRLGSPDRPATTG